MKYADIMVEILFIIAACLTLPPAAGLILGWSGLLIGGLFCIPATIAGAAFFVLGAAAAPGSRGTSGYLGFVVIGILIMLASVVAGLGLLLGGFIVS